MEALDQIGDGCSLQVAVPKKRLFISAGAVKDKARAPVVGAASGGGTLWDLSSGACHQRSESEEL